MCIYVYMCISAPGPGMVGWSVERMIACVFLLLVYLFVCLLACLVHCSSNRVFSRLITCLVCRHQSTSQLANQPTRQPANQRSSQSAKYTKNQSSWVQNPTNIHQVGTPNPPSWVPKSTKICLGGSLGEVLGPSWPQEGPKSQNAPKPKR